MSWANPWYFLLLILVPLMVGWYIYTLKRPAPTITLPSVSRLRPLISNWQKIVRHVPVFLRIAAVGFMVVALARPQMALDEEKVNTEGIDLVIALDISSSMLARDLEPENRLEAAKRVANEFISGRTSDRIGLVMFAGESYTWCPLTLDYDVLVELMSQVEPGTVEDGTAIGKAIATGANRLRYGDAKSRVLILLTDGVNNVDQPDPLTAALAAAGMGIKIYTIGVGTDGEAEAPVQTPFGVQYRRVKLELDEELLRQIADRTGGKYFRAQSTEALRGIYNEIDRLEKIKIEVEHIRRWREMFAPWAIVALILLMLERVIVISKFRNLAT